MTEIKSEALEEYAKFDTLIPTKSYLNKEKGIQLRPSNQFSFQVS